MLCFKIIIKIPQILMKIQEKHDVFKQKIKNPLKYKKNEVYLQRVQPKHNVQPG